MKRRFLLPIATASLVRCATGDAPKVHGDDVDSGAQDASIDATPRTDSGADAGADATSDQFTPPVDASVDSAPADAAKDAPTGCVSGTTAFVAGSASSFVTGSWIAKSLPVVSSGAGSVIDRVAVAKAGSGLVAAFRSNGNALSFATFSSSWSASVGVPSSKAALGAPSLASLGSAAHLAYHDSNFKFEHRTYSSGAWDVSDDPVGGSGQSQAFGPSAPAVASAGSDLVLVQAGDDGLLYDWTWANVWKPAHQNSSALLEKGISPSITALSGGKSELLAVYMRKGDFKLMSLARTSGVWDTVPTQVDPNAFANDPVALAPLPSGKALVVYRGSNSQPYFSVYDATKSPAWTSPAALLTQNPLVSSTPSIATGVCGDVAVVAFARQGGGVELAHFDGTSFTGPDLITGTTGATFVGIATLP